MDAIKVAELIEIVLNPGQYGYVECPHCNGYGSSLKEAAPRCTRCNGLGLINPTRENHDDGEEGRQRA